MKEKIKGVQAWAAYEVEERKIPRTD